MRLAKVRHRVMATIVDNLIIIAMMLIVFIGIWPQFIYALHHELIINYIMIIKLVKSGMVYALFLLFYYMFIPTFIKGQTIGKWLFKIKIVNENGTDVDYKVLFFREAICRILVRTISFGISSIVSYLIMLIRDDKKSLADVFVKTKVIDIKEELNNVNSTQRS